MKHNRKRSAAKGIIFRDVTLPYRYDAPSGDWCIPKEPFGQVRISLTLPSDISDLCACFVEFTYAGELFCLYCKYVTDIFKQLLWTNVDGSAFLRVKGKSQNPTQNCLEKNAV